MGRSRIPRFPVTVNRALHLLGDVAAGGDPPDLGTARRYYAEALALAQALGMQPLVAQCQERLGALA